MLETRKAIGASSAVVNVFSMDIRHMSRWVVNVGVIRRPERARDVFLSVRRARNAAAIKLAIWNRCGSCCMCKMGTHAVLCRGRRVAVKANVMHTLDPVR